MNKYKRLGKNTVLIFLGNAGSRLIGLLMLPLYTRWLGPQEYGTVDVVNTYAMLLISLVVWCITDAIFVIPKNGTEDEKKSYFTTGWIFSILGFVVAAAIFFILEVIFRTKGIENSFASNLWYVYFIMLGTFLQQYTQQFTRCIDKMGVYSITGIVHTFFLAVLSFVFIPKYGVGGYITAYVIAYVVSAAYSFVFSGSYKYIDFGKVSNERLKTLLKYSIPLIPNTAMWWLVSGLNRPLIEANTGMEANGILAVANRIPGIIGMLFTIFNNAWVISMMEEYGKPDFAKFFNIAVRCVMFPTILAAIVLSIFMKPIIMILADAAYIEAYKYAPIAIMAVILSNLSGLIGGVFAAKKQSKYFFYSSFWAALTSVVFMFILIPPFGLYGATIAMCLSYIAATISRCYYTKDDLKGFEMKPIVISLALFAIVVFLVVVNIPLWIKSILYIIIVLYLFRVNKDVLNSMVSKLSSFPKHFHLKD